MVDGLARSEVSGNESPIAIRTPVGRRSRKGPLRQTRRKRRSQKRKTTGKVREEHQGGLGNQYDRVGAGEAGRLVSGVDAKRFDDAVRAVETDLLRLGARRGDKRCPCSAAS